MLNMSIHWICVKRSLIFTGENVSSLSKAAEREMLTALAARKEALLEKLKERTEELKALCVQEAVGSDKHTTSPHNFHT